MKTQVYELKFRQKKKFFHRDKMIVETFYGDEYTTSELINELQCLKFAHNIGLGPKVKHYDLERRYFVEELFEERMKIPANWDEAKDIIDKYALPILQKLLLSSSIERSNAKILKPDVDLVMHAVRISNLYLPIEFISYCDVEIKNFREKNIVYLRGKSHGDFKFDHIMLNQGQTKVIDWDSLGTRSAHFDYFNLIAPWLLHHEVDLNMRRDVITHVSLISSFAEDKLEEGGIETANLNDLMHIFLIERLSRIIKGNSSDIIKKQSLKRQIQAHSKLCKVLFG